MYKIFTQKVKIFSLLLFAITGFFVYSFSQDVFAQWEASGNGIKESNITMVLADFKDDAIYAATDFFIYVSRDKGQNWEQIFSSPGKENFINFFAVTNSQNNTVFAATKNGLYASLNNNKKWEKIYYKASPAQNNINYVVLDSDNVDLVYISNDSGFFISQDKGKTWRNASISLGTASVRAVLVKPAYRIDTLTVMPDQRDIFISSDKGIFKSKDNGVTWQNVYTIFRKDDSVVYENDVEEREESAVNINSFAINSNKQNEIYAATSKGVLFSQDDGQTWSFMTNLGLGSNDARQIFISAKAGDNFIYITTYKGVFMYDQSNSRWVELQKGASFRDARFLSLDVKNDILWIATGDGLYKAPQSKIINIVRQADVSKDIFNMFNGEPTITDVQRAAIKYAEVHPDKIKTWRRQARAKAFLPEVTLSYDKTVSVSTSSNNFVVGPEDWGVSFKWNVGDFVFSDDQTNIDVRSRLMVQLRDDILDDVTRLYYERRRLKIDLFTSVPKNSKERYDKLLRLEELTANIDALTGGFFSSNIVYKEGV